MIWWLFVMCSCYYIAIVLTSIKKKKFIEDEILWITTSLVYLTIFLIDKPYVITIIPLFYIIIKIKNKNNSRPYIEKNKIIITTLILVTLSLILRIYEEDLYTIILYSGWVSLIIILFVIDYEWYKRKDVDAFIIQNGLLVMGIVLTCLFPKTLVTLAVMLICIIFIP